jgi:hypothetical protein
MVIIQREIISDFMHCDKCSSLWILSKTFENCHQNIQLIIIYLKDMCTFSVTAG